MKEWLVGATFLGFWALCGLLSLGFVGVIIWAIVRIVLKLT